MKLSQRLTRAGLTFILLGSVAAVMPQQSGAVSAANPTTCDGTGRTFNISNGSGSVQPTYALAASQADTYTSKLDSSPSGTVSATQTGTATVTGSGSGSVTVTAPASGANNGTVSLTATTTAGINTYNADATVTYNY